MGDSITADIRIKLNVVLAEMWVEKRTIFQTYFQSKFHSMCPFQQKHMSHRKPLLSHRLCRTHRLGAATHRQRIAHSSHFTDWLIVMMRNSSLQNNSPQKKKTWVIFFYITQWNNQRFSAFFFTQQKNTPSDLPNKCPSSRPSITSPWFQFQVDQSSKLP